jgi:hypothetical protein
MMKQPESQHEKQIQQILAEFNTNYSIALKPYGDLAKSFGAYIQVTNVMLAEKDQEIARLRGQVVKEANRDVQLPSIKAASKAV